MGLKQVAQNLLNQGLNTGLGQAAINSGKSILGDQWKEFFYCDAIPVDTLVVKGQKRVGPKSQNKNGSDNIITNGSVIAVNEGQCMIIVDQGQVVELCAVPGEYVYDMSTEPSVFTGDLKESLLNAVKTAGRRISFGGDTGHDQRIYFFNIKEIMDNKFGTPNPVPFRVTYEDLGRSFTVGVRCNGIYSYRITDPMVFFQKVCGNIPDRYMRSQIDNQLKSEFLNALQPGFTQLSSSIRYDELPGNTVALTKAMQDVLAQEWTEKRGIEIVSVSINSVNIPQEDEDRIKKFEDLAWNRNPANAAAVMVGAQAEAMNAAASNPNGAMMGFYGMNMAQQMGGMNANALFGMAAQQQAAQPAPAAAPAPAPAPAAPAAGSWTCSCGASNTGKFCAECGNPKPADAEGWTCTCGTTNKGKFCAECGKPKPAGTPKYKCDKCGWEPADPFNPPKFCGECGDPFNDADIVR